MSQTDRIVECLESLTPKGCCDDCLSRKTRIKPRKTVSQICSTLAAEGKLVRKRGKCPLGDHTKMLNTLSGRRAATGSDAPATGDLTIEEAWRYVDRFCRGLWNKELKTETPSSLADIITTLRDEELVPAHEANMMHTIRSLRNMVVHENPGFGALENTIAQAAWVIVRKWAQEREAELWRLTTTVCRAA
jgi:hypothetical protein